MTETTMTATPNLNKALSQLQGELPRITKTKTGKIEGENKAGKYFSYEYSYADLGDVVADVGPLLAKHGLAFHCGPTINPADRREMVLVWSLLHASGEERRGEWPLGPVSQKPQSLGSAITYGRRYCFTAATNIVLEDDDDGQRAQQDHGTRQSAGDAWENATPAKPANQPAGSWYDDAIAAAAVFKSDAEGQKLWREAATAHREGRCTRKEADHVQNLVSARISDRRKDAAATILAPLAPDDAWRDKILGDLDSDDDARTALAEVQEMAAGGQMADTRAELLGRAIIVRFPKAAVKELKAVKDSGEAA